MSVVALVYHTQLALLDVSVTARNGGKADSTRTIKCALLHLFIV